MNCHYMISFSDLIQILTLGVVLYYTIVTHRIFRQQRDQFTRSLRPWVSADDILYNKRLVLPELGVLIRNIGKLPAMCNIRVTRLSIKHPFEDQPVSLIQNDEVKDFPVFPFVEGTDSAHIFFFNLTEDQNIFFVEGVKIECDIKIYYTILDDLKQTKPFEFEGNLLVERFTEKINKQTTIITITKAT
jgi:hypothetical protein